MKRVGIILIFVVIISFVFQACQEKSSGMIRIVSVSPDSRLVDGKFYDFIVHVEYELYNTPGGELHVGFNTPNPNVISFVVSQTALFPEGSGDHYFFPKSIQAVDWGPAGDFKAYVEIVGSDNVLKPLDFDTMILTF
jgi:hypothetical protein